MPRTDERRALIGPAASRPVLRRILLVLFALFWVCWLLGVIGISRNMTFPIDERWAGSVSLFLEGMVAFLWVAYTGGGRRAFRFAAAVLPLAFAVEYLGVTVGLPFGRYRYTSALVPRILGVIPAPITLAWLMIALGSLAMAAAALPGRNRVPAVVFAAALATALDACLEPVAVHVKAYWIWEASGPYYGVPNLNFVGWFVTALVINAVAAAVLWRGAPPLSLQLVGIPISLYWGTVAMFATIDGFRGYPLGTAIGGALVIGVGAMIAARSRHPLAAVASRRHGLSTRPARAGASEPSSRE